ncbi:TerB family tellurite resistance protein [Pedobacter aquatilis]|uniref:TerB family tellurite resistance protein n=1 Tax=Pedobacter aquatilis TaxID=351343 RepID=UPI0029307404|nr:TerB family tellurite resistance protein [Pedobacter aquatilis]
MGWIKCVLLRVLMWGILSAGLCLLSVRSALAQSAEAEQLLLNVEKLSQLKNILADMKKGYQVISTGYNSVKNIAQGNFSLHDVFLNGLWLVSPEVRKYYKISEVIAAEKDLVVEYRSAFSRFSTAGVFSPSELSYFSSVYGKLLSESLDHLDELAMAITAGSLRMSDEERLSSIDRIHAGMQDKLVFLRTFNRKNSVLQVQRLREVQEIRSLGDYFKQ